MPDPVSDPAGDAHQGPGGPGLEAAGQLVGVPDAFQRLWAPHRMAYLDGENKPADTGEAACPFCRAPGRDDADALVVARGQHAYVVLNLYPYNPGHVLVCPYRHVGDLTELTGDEMAELGALTRQAMLAARASAAPPGFNIGINQGSAAGAGIGAHLHQHVVPRWGGDSNFLPIVARTKAVPVLLGETRRLLAQAWPASPGVTTRV